LIRRLHDFENDRASSTDVGAVSGNLAEFSSRSTDPAMRRIHVQTAATLNSHDSKLGLLISPVIEPITLRELQRLEISKAGPRAKSVWC
jgi:hypothetical protein